MEVNEPALVAAAATVVAAFGLFPRHSLQLHHLDPEVPMSKEYIVQLKYIYNSTIAGRKIILFQSFFTVGLDSKDLRLPTFPILDG
jgi:hypothetical protein